MVVVEVVVEVVVVIIVMIAFEVGIVVRRLVVVMVVVLVRLRSEPDLTDVGQIIEMAIVPVDMVMAVAVISDELEGDIEWRLLRKTN